MFFFVKMCYFSLHCNLQTFAAILCTNEWLFRVYLFYFIVIIFNLFVDFFIYLFFSRWYTLGLFSWRNNPKSGTKKSFSVGWLFSSKGTCWMTMVSTMQESFISSLWFESMRAVGCWFSLAFSECIANKYIGAQRALFLSD